MAIKIGSFTDLTLSQLDPGKAWIPFRYSVNQIRASPVESFSRFHRVKGDHVAFHRASACIHRVLRMPLSMAIEIGSLINDAFSIIGLYGRRDYIQSSSISIACFGY